MDDTARLIVTVLLAAFAIERIGAAVGFLTGTPRGPERTRKIYNFLLVAVLGALAVGLAHIRVLERLSTKASPWIDYPLSWLILVAGADRIRDFVGAGGGGSAAPKAPAKSELPPIQINITDRDGQTTLHEVKA
ncbi:MAG TPA: hypothetical protein VJZ76_02530 [Thermoanaerobaculia bacterium]|nr:hypothetical protein [Thermoanaerobaculia bacterium]